jgi:hypothetical protein
MANTYQDNLSGSQGFVPTSLRMMLGMSVGYVAFEFAMRQATAYNSKTADA